jgi:hypothetical protein
MDDEAFDDSGTVTPARWRGAITWSSLVLVGVVLYELTNQPALGTAGLCLKFGWEDFKTANWLYRYDPRRARGRACWWLYTAAGFWKAAGVALLTNAVVILGLAYLLWHARAPAVDRLMRSFVGAGVTTMGGCIIAAFMATVAVGIAWRNGVRLWLDGTATRARRANVWPPVGPDFPRANRLVWLLVTAAYVSYTFAMIVAVQFIERLKQAGPGDLLLGALAWCTLIVPALIASRLQLAVGAHSAAQCWPPDELAAWPDDPLE